MIYPVVCAAFCVDLLNVAKDRRPYPLGRATRGGQWRLWGNEVLVRIEGKPFMPAPYLGAGCVAVSCCRTAAQALSSPSPEERHTG